MYFLKNILNFDIKVTTQFLKINDIDVEYQYNKHYFIINPSNYGTNDKVIISKLIYEIASTIDISNFQKKIIIIKKVEKITREAINALRVVLEKTKKTCIFILLSNNLSKTFGPITSRCTLFKLGHYNKQNIITVLDYIIKNENIKIIRKNLNQFYETANNLNDSILSLENYKHTNKFIKFKTPANILIDLIEKAIDIKNILLLREQITIFINNNFDLTEIYLDIISHYSNKMYPHINIFELVSYAAKYQENSIKGNREFFHLEAFIIKLYYLHHCTK